MMKKNLGIIELDKGVNYIYSRNREKFSFKNVIEIDPKNEKSFCNLVKELQNDGIELTKLYTLKCVHGNKILDLEILQKDCQITEIDLLSGISLFVPKSVEADGLFTSDVTKKLAIFPADCCILGIYDPVDKRKGLIHAGWRGTLQDITVKAIDIFRMKGSKLSNLKIILSPMIRELVIGQDTIWEFEEYIEKKGSMYNKFVRKTKDDKYIIDLKGIIIMSLLDRGINLKNILNNKSEDTFSEVDRNSKYLYESYRRDKGKSRRNVVII